MEEEAQKIRIKVLDQRDIQISEEEFLPTSNQILLGLIRFLDLKHLIAHKELLDFYKQLSNYCLQNQIENSCFFSELKGKVFCVICKQRLSELVLSCNHGYCEECLIKHIKEKTNGFIITTIYEENYMAKCRENKCSKRICDEDLKDLFRDTWNELKEQAEERENLQEAEKVGKKRCVNCKKLRSFELFLHECKHCCIFCESNSINIGVNACEKCQSVRMRGEALEVLFNSKCSACGLKKSYITDHLLEICEGHIHCLDCLKRVWQTKECGYCGVRLPIDKNFMEIYERIFRKCVICKKTKTVDMLTEKACCKYNICLICQIESHMLENCCFCEELLPPDVYRKILELTK